MYLLNFSLLLSTLIPIVSSQPTRTLPVSLYASPPAKASQPQLLHEQKAIFESSDLGAQNRVQHIFQHPPPNPVESGNGRGGKQGVVAKHNKGNITMHTKDLDESVKLGFEFVLADNESVKAETCSDKAAEEKEKEGRFELRSVNAETVEDGRDGAVLWLINDLVENMILRYPNGLGVIDHTITGNVSSTSRSDSNGGRYTASMNVTISYVGGDDDDGKKGQDSSTVAHDKDITEDEDALMTDRDEWLLLLGLLKATATILKRDILGWEKSFSDLRLEGEIYGMLFEVRWKFGEVSC